MKIVVIGNSPSAIEKPLGKIIDSFDVVVRINNFITDGFEDKIGSKTDYLFITFATRPDSNISKFNKKKIYMFVADKYGQNDFIQGRVNKDNGTKIDISKVNILDSNIYLTKLNKKIGIELPQRPLTGTIAIDWALNHFPECELYTLGIDYYKEEGNILYRYTGFNNKREPYFHGFDKEKAYYEKLVKTKKIMGDLKNARL